MLFLISILQFVNVNQLINLWILKNPCILGINLSRSWYIILLIYCWMQIASILLRIFVSVLISDCDFAAKSYLTLFQHHGLQSVTLACNFRFCGIFVWFWYQGDSGFIAWVWEFSFLCKFWKYFRGISVSASLNVW